MSARFLREERGQAMVLSALTLLVITIAVMLTFAIGQRVREKTKLQATADAAAYSMAVAEARAFNFYAWSNRAMVAHAVSILSVQAHISYLTWYGDMLYGAANDLNGIADQLQAPGARCGCARQASLRARAAADVFLNWNSGMNGQPWATPAGGGAGGARWYRNAWEYKWGTGSAPAASNNYCWDMLRGARDHWFNREALIHDQQLDVDHQLRWLFTGEHYTRKRKLHAPYDPAGDGDEDDDSHPDPDPFSDDDSGDNFAFAAGAPTLAEQIAQNVDPGGAGRDGLHARKSGGELSRHFYDQAVDTAPLEHVDWDEILYGTRYPDWLVARGFRPGSKWAALVHQAESKLGGDRMAFDVHNAGIAGALGRLDSSSRNPGAWGNHDAHGLSAHINFAEEPLTDAQFELEPTPRAGDRLAAELHRFAHDRAVANELGDSGGVGAEDHGFVAIAYRPASCTCAGLAFHTTPIRPGRDGTYSDGRANAAAGEGFHTFYDYASYHRGHRLGTRANGLYPGHMLFRLHSEAAKDGELWNMPRTFAAIYSKVNEPGRPWPWDLDFGSDIGGRSFRFTTLHSAGDAATRGEMTAIASGLVYFHKPASGSPENSKEPPNFWNPFWRAKLHPLRSGDALQLDDAPETARILRDLGGARASSEAQRVLNE